MKSFTAIMSIFICLSANAGLGRIDQFKCTIEDGQIGNISSESLLLEHGTHLYAPVFKGDIAAGIGAVKLSSKTVDDLVFIKSKNGDKLTLTLTLIGTNHTKTLKNYKYVERLDADEVSKISLRTGFCTAYNVSQ
jgi:hypothetical protein